LAQKTDETPTEHNITLLGGLKKYFYDKKLVGVSLIYCSLFGCETADGVMSDIKFIVEYVSGYINKVRNEY
jgi:hypothetical protein